MKRLTIFCHYDRDNIIDDYVIYWLKYMSKLSDIIFISDNNLPEIESQKVNNLVIKSIIGRHGGTGAVSVKIGYKYAYDNNLIENYDWLFIINDSIYGPFFDIEPFILKQEKKENIAYGFTLSGYNTTNFHIQSTFIAIPKSIFTSKEFVDFFDSIKDIYNKDIEVEKYEYGISKLILNMGYKLEGFFDDENNIEIYDRYEPVRPAFVEMVKKGYPFVRRAIFTKNYYFIENLNDYLELEHIIPKECFDNMIKHIDRVINKDDLNININYPWIRQYLTEKESKITNYYINNYNNHIDIFGKKTFIEKLNWIKIYYNDPLMIKCSDKYEVREYIKEKIGEQYLIPLFGVYNNYAEIVSNLNIKDFQDSIIMMGTINENYYLIDDFQKYTNDKIRQNAFSFIDFSNNQFLRNLEWCYKYIKARVLVYKNIYTNNFKYKVLCFNSEPKVIKVTYFENNNYFANFYDLEWNLLNVKQEFEQYSNINKPKFLDKMIELSKILSKDFPYFVAIDFIETDDKLYFKKYDFYSNEITYPLSDDSFNIEWGNNIKLPNILNEYLVLDKNTISKTMSLFDRYANIEYTNTRKKQNTNFYIRFLTIFNINLFALEKSDKFIVIYILGLKISIKSNKKIDKVYL